MSAPRDEERVVLDSPPPFLGSWKRVYVAVLVSQALLIIGLALLTELAS